MPPEHGNTPLHEAAWRGYSRSVKLLCKNIVQDAQGSLHGTLLSPRNNYGFSPLHLASQNGHNQSCRELLLAGADPDVQNNYGDTSLHTACRYGHAGATRILLSAKCDPLRVNLNGDTPLHIACAMGRRKLTRILLEAGGPIGLTLKNAQNETPRDIAARKNLTEIIEILNKPLPPRAEETIRRDRERSSSSSRHHKKEHGDKQKTKKKGKDSANVPESNTVNSKNWSPYGCHYFPDPRTFPSPKLETLPKEPLANGEQYFLDLAGNIKKGPIGVGNTCYCGPFFRHIEQRVSQNKKSIKKYVHKATEKLDSKVQALALQTDDKIEQIARSMMIERIAGCAGRGAHLEQWLKRGNHLRATVAVHTSKERKDRSHNTLTRCRSLEILDNSHKVKRLNQTASGANIGRSFDMLDSNKHEVIVHRGQDDDIEEDRKTPEPQKHSVLDQQEPEFIRTKLKLYDKNAALSVAERLEQLLTKTNEIIQMERVARQKNKQTNPLSDLRNQSLKLNGKLKVSPSKQQEKNRNGHNYEQSLIKKFERLDYSYPSDNRSETAVDFDSKSRKSDVKNKEKKIKNENKIRYQMENSDESSESDESHHPINYKKILKKVNGFLHSSNSGIRNNGHNEENSNFDIEQYQGNYYQTDTIDADVSSATDPVAKVNENKIMQPFGGGFFQNTCFEDVSNSSSNTLKSVKFESAASASVDEIDSRGELPEMANTKELYELKSRILNGAHWRSQVLRKSTQDVNKLAVEINLENKNTEQERTSDKNESVQPSLSSNKSQVSEEQMDLSKRKVNELIAKFQVNREKTVSFLDNKYEESESSEDECEADNSAGAQYQDNSDNPKMLPVQSGIYFNKEQRLDTLKNGSIPTSSKRSATNSKPYPIIGPKPLKIPIDIRQQIHPMTVLKTLNTRSLIPKDAYFHDLPVKNTHKSVEKGKPSDSLASNNGDRDRNQQSYAGTSDDEILAPSQPPPLVLPNYLKNNNIHQMYMNQMSHLNHHNSPSIIQPPSIEIFPNGERLLSSRKFGPTNVTSISTNSSNDPKLIHINPSTLCDLTNNNITNTKYNLPIYKPIVPSINDKVQQLERDMNNDSGYSTKTCENSHIPSPSLPGPTEPNTVGSSNSGLSSTNLLTPNMNTSVENIDNQSKYNNNNREYLFTNISASSLV